MNNSERPITTESPEFKEFQERIKAVVNTLNARFDKTMYKKYEHLSFLGEGRYLVKVWETGSLFTKTERKDTMNLQIALWEAALVEGSGKGKLIWREMFEIAVNPEETYAKMENEFIKYCLNL